MAKIIHRIVTTCGFLVICSLAYLNLGITVPNFINHLISAKIISEKDLDAVVKLEKKRLGITMPVRATVVENLFKEKHVQCRISRSDESKTNKAYEMEVAKNYLDVGCVRHELYHIYGGHFRYIDADPVLKSILYWFYFEPACNLYALLGLRV